MPVCLLLQRCLDIEREDDLVSFVYQLKVQAPERAVARNSD